MPEHSPSPTPSRAVYGFGMHLAMKSFFILYILWAMVPQQWFESIGITYMPQRYWTIGVPVFLMTVLAIFAFVFYPSLGLCMTPNFYDIKTITDSRALAMERISKYSDPTGASFQCVCRSKDGCEKDVFERIKKDAFIKNTVAVVYDLPINKVSMDLYL